MTFEIGNQWWLARSKHGRNPKFSDPVVLWEACCEYFKWVQDNPLLEDKVFQYEGKGVHEELKKMRVMTLSGLGIFLDITYKTWCNYREVDDLLHITKQVEEIIYTQKFSGATSGFFNANIIARDLGLADKKVVEQSILIGEMNVEDMSDEQLQRELDQEE